MYTKDRGKNELEKTMDESIFEMRTLPDFFYSMNAKHRNNAGKHLDKAVRKNIGVNEIIKTHLDKLQDIDSINAARKLQKKNKRLHEKLSSSHTE